MIVVRHRNFACPKRSKNRGAFWGGYSGVMLDMYAQKIAVFNSQIHDVGYGGVLIVGAYDNLDPLVSRDNLIQNNHIYNIGQLVGHGVGVHIEASAYNHINHNEIHNSNRYGIAIVGSYDNSPTVNLAANNRVDYNKVYNLNNDTADTGNIYQYTSGRYNICDHNLSYDSNSLSSVNAAFYLDARPANRSGERSLADNLPRLDSRSHEAPTTTRGGHGFRTPNEKHRNSHSFRKAYILI